MLLYTQFVQSLYNWAFKTKITLTIYLIFLFTIFIPILFSFLRFSFIFFLIKYSCITYLDGGDLMYQKMFLRICLTRTPGKLSGLYTVQGCIFSFCPLLPGSHEDAHLLGTRDIFPGPECDSMGDDFMMIF